MIPEDPLGQTKAAYAINLLLTRFLTPDRYGLPDVELVRDLLALGPNDHRSPLDAKEFVQKLLAFLDDQGPGLRRPPPPKQPVRRNLKLLSDMLNLNRIERAVLTFILAARDPDARHLLQTLADRLSVDPAQIVAAAIGSDIAAVRESLRPGGPLRDLGIIIISNRGVVADRIDCDPRLPELLGRPNMTRDEVLDRLLPSAPAPELNTADFGHVRSHLDRVTVLLRNAITRRQPGVNVLLHGPTGTGKTEFAKLVAQLTDARLLVAGATDENGKSPHPGERLTSLLIGNKLATRGRGLLLFDELEDLFTSRAYWGSLAAGTFDTPTMSKQWFNRLLETNPVPTIWTANSVQRIDSAFLRRISYVIEIGDFNAAQRRRAWQRHLRGDDAVTPADLEALVRQFEVSPAHIGSAIRTGRLITGAGADRPTLEAVLEPSARLARRGLPAHRPFESDRYLLDAVNSPVDLHALATRAAAWRPGPGRGLTLCLHGPPGTGKTEFARYLAHRMDRPLLIRRVSDILSPWVGENERNISRAFAQAHADDAVLLFDEADSFLRDRRTAVRSWEVTEVNEFLQQLESFPGVVACTTNLVEGLDPAVLRRFVFKVPFDYLRAEQAQLLFERTLRALGGEVGADESWAVEIALLKNLAAGDFAAVERRLQILGGPVNPARLLEELRSELTAKRETARRAGFV